MSTIDITPAVTTRLRLTVRGRRVLAALAAIPAAVALSAAILGGGAALASRASSSVHFETVTAQAGDTLWGIAQEVAPNDDPRDVVDAIIDLNALDRVTLVPGQRISIPTQYTDK